MPKKPGTKAPTPKPPSKLFKNLIAAGFVLVGTVASGLFVLQLQQTPEELVASKVVRVANYAGTSGGTGFLVKGNSGKTYILTNAHVCELSEKTKLFTHEEGRPVARRIIEVSEVADLCLLEADPSSEGLDLATDVQPQQFVKIIGHPLLKPVTIEEGRISFKEQVDVLGFVIENDEQREACAGPTKRIEKVNFFFFQIDACIISQMAYMVNAVSYPGNSGSPVVDERGDVVGVLFASNNKNWSFVVPLEEVKAFLDKH